MTDSIKRTPPTTHEKSIQQDLFSYFVTNDAASVSNTVEFWESIPKYFFTPQQVKNLRSDGLAKPYAHEFLFEGITFKVKIQPAMVEQEDGSYLAFFPSVTEELVEEALKKIFTQQNYGFHDPANTESWVRFSQSMIFKELKERGRSRSRNEIKHAIEVLSGTIITLYKEGKEMWKGSILQDLVTVDRQEYLADTTAHHIARLPLFVSHAINQLEYRQFNYDRLMQCNSQLTRWIYKQMIHRYRQAAVTNTYHFMYSNIQRDSGLLQQNTDKHNRQKLEKCVAELKDRGVIMSYTALPQRTGRKITDVKYTVIPSSEFAAEQKAANRRASDIGDKASKMGVPVDNRSKVVGLTAGK